MRCSIPLREESKYIFSGCMLEMLEILLVYSIIMYTISSAYTHIFTHMIAYLIVVLYSHLYTSAPYTGPSAVSCYLATPHPLPSYVYTQVSGPLQYTISQCWRIVHCVSIAHDMLGQYKLINPSPSSYVYMCICICRQIVKGEEDRCIDRGYTQHSWRLSSYHRYACNGYVILIIYVINICIQ